VSRRDGLLLALLAATHLFFSNEFRAFANPNVRSRVYLTLAVIDHGTLSIDEPVRRFGTIQDRAEFGGRRFTDKAPGYSLALVPLAWTFRRLGVAYDDLRTMSILLRVFGLSLPAVWFWFGTRRHWTALAGDERRGAAVVLAGALGTNFFIYSTHLFSHAAAGMLVFLAYLAARQSPRPGYAALAGLLLATAFTFDYVIAPAAAVVALFVVARGRDARRRAGAAASLLAAALPLAAGWMAYNQACFGRPIAAGFLHHSDKRYGPEYRKGVFGVQSPRLDAVAGMTVLPKRGLFFLSPFLLLAPLGWWRVYSSARAPAAARPTAHSKRERPARRSDEASRAAAPHAAAMDRGTAAAAVACVAGLFAFVTTTVDWMGGWSMSVRYLVPAIPFLLEGVALALAEPYRALSHGFFRLGALLGIFQTAVAAATYPHFPKEFLHPYYDLCLTLLRGGYVNGTLWNADAIVLDLLPFSGLIVAALVFVTSWSGPRGTRESRAARWTPIVAAALAVAGQAAGSWRLDYRRRIALADVVVKMGYKCASDAQRAQLHAEALGLDRGAEPSALSPRGSYDLTQLALLRATSPCDDLRDGAAAMILAQRAVKLFGENHPPALDALAAALAETGRIDAAREVGRRARQLAPKNPRSNAVWWAAQRLAAYERGEPYREPMTHR